VARERWASAQRLAEIAGCSSDATGRAFVLLPIELPPLGRLRSVLRTR